MNEFQSARGVGTRQMNWEKGKGVGGVGGAQHFSLLNWVCRGQSAREEFLSFMMKEEIIFHGRFLHQGHL